MRCFNCSILYELWKCAGSHTAQSVVSWRLHVFVFAPVQLLCALPCPCLLFFSCGDKGVSAAELIRPASPGRKDIQKRKGESMCTRDVR